MKKLIIITSIIFLSCEQENNNECKCQAVYGLATEQGGTFEVNNMPIDCTTRKPLKQVQSNAYFIRCK